MRQRTRVIGTWECNRQEGKEALDEDFACLYLVEYTLQVYWF